MLSMAIDHVGIVFFPDSDTWRIIGRLAFPLYAFGIVQGFMWTRSRQRYLNRLLWLSAASQVPYMLAFQASEINVIGTFAVCLAVLIGIDQIQNRWIKAVILAAAGAFLEIVPFDYGVYALLLVLIYRYTDGGKRITLHALLNVASWLLLGWFLQLYSLAATFILTRLKRNRFTVPRWLWRSFYPAHLSILAIVVVFRPF